MVIDEESNLKARCDKLLMCEHKKIDNIAEFRYLIDGSVQNL